MLVVKRFRVKRANIYRPSLWTGSPWGIDMFGRHLVPHTPGRNVGISGANNTEVDTHELCASSCWQGVVILNERVRHGVACQALAPFHQSQDPKSRNIEWLVGCSGKTCYEPRPQRHSAAGSPPTPEKSSSLKHSRGSLVERAYRRGLVTVL